MKHVYFVECTDTFSGEANYSWVKRVHVRASSAVGAIRKARSHWGHAGRIRKSWNSGDETRYDAQGACICYFVAFCDNPDTEAF